jgi:hypothetical protein
LTYGVGLLLTGAQPSAATVLRFAGALLFLGGSVFAFKKL